MSTIDGKPIRPGEPAGDANAIIRLDTEQIHFLREGIEARAEYFRGVEIDNSDLANLTLALAWFRAYWLDCLARRARHDRKRASHSPTPTPTRTSP